MSADVKLPDGRSFEFWDDRTKYTHVYHVAQKHPRASDDNPGSQDAPFATISKAAAVLAPGQKVIVHEGIYRECVRPARGGTGVDKMVCYEAAAGEQVIVRGSEIWRADFQPSVGWYANRRRRSLPDVPVMMGDLPGEILAGYNPFMINNMPWAYNNYGWTWTVDETRRFQLRRGAVFHDGKPLRQVFDYHELVESDGVFWVEDPGLRIHFRLFGDANPASAQIEVTVREQVFAPQQRRLEYIRVRGFTFDHAADGIPVPQRACLSASRGRRWIIEDNTVRFANGTGIDIGNEDWRAVREAGDKGGHIVRRNRISDCGICGIAGVDNVDNSLIENNIIERIGYLDVERILECAAVKFHTCDGVLIRGNVFRHLDHACGVWLDFLVSNCRISGNVFADINTILGAAYVEVSHKPNVVDGNIVWDVRDADMRKADKPKHVMHGGLGIDSDSSENVTVAHNLVGSVGGNYAISLHLQQGGRIVGGRVGMCRGHGVYNNVVVGCPRRVLLSRGEGNSVDGNFYDAGDDWTSHVVQQGDHPSIMNLAGWREFFGYDRAGGQARVAAAFDADALTLCLKVEGDLASPVAVPALCGEASYPAVGPFDAKQWQTLIDGGSLSFVNGEWR